MDTAAAVARLESKRVKPTANRIIVLRHLDACGRPASLSDLCAKLVTLDKSSVFRVLTLFLQREVVHAFEDGRGVVHYELCRDDGECSHNDNHVHFYCESCHESFCITTMRVPAPRLPEGFAPHTVSYVVKGVCPRCTGKAENPDTHW